jgi:hypothetical protein
MEGHGVYVWRCVLSVRRSDHLIPSLSHPSVPSATTACTLLMPFLSTTNAVFPFARTVDSRARIHTLAPLSAALTSHWPTSSHSRWSSYTLHTKLKSPWLPSDTTQRAQQQREGSE